ncbi:Asp23/Gls24 family envelope stress response protein [Streptomyces sp. NPDC005548]|uniref:Asp23/Gls24 family envelope stress response protein n=1 Tax=Streptomyces sp. NPDC005548 TaxID=3364724 RepID=UPI0036CC9CD6
MSTSAAGTPPSQPAQGSRPPVAAAERGRTVIPDKVLARIAARAANEALTAQNGTPPTRMGLAAPQSAVSAGSGTARIALTLDLPYPIDLARASGALQRYVRERVAQLTGMRITEVTVAIEHLIPPGGLDRRRVQ